MPRTKRSTEHGAAPVRGSTRRDRLSLRNRRGQDVELESFSATDAKNEFGRMLTTALQHGGVTITRHDELLAVVLDVDEYRALVDAQTKSLDVLTAEFDTVLQRMQSSKSRAGAEKAFGASPAELGKAAVNASKRRG